jgi:hypothetical protein
VTLLGHVPVPVVPDLEAEREHENHAAYDCHNGRDGQWRNIQEERDDRAERDRHSQEREKNDCIELHAF